MKFFSKHGEPSKTVQPLSEPTSAGHYYPTELPLGFDDEGLLKWVDLNGVTHIFITGATGYGKTETTKRLIAWLIKNGFGFLFLDPRGEPATKVVELYAAIKGPDSGKDFIYISPRKTQQYKHTVVVNPLDLGFEDANTLVGQLHAMNSTSWGPKLASVLRNAIQCIIMCPVVCQHCRHSHGDVERCQECGICNDWTPITYKNITALRRFIMDEHFREGVILPLLPPSLSCKQFFLTMYKNEYGSDKGASAFNKLDPIMTPRVMPTLDAMGLADSDGAALVSESKSVDWASVIMENKQVIADLGDIDMESCQFLGSVILLTVLSKLRGLSSLRSEKKEVKPFFIIIDEASYFATVIPAMMRELFNSRTFKANMIANTQTLDESKIPFAKEINELCSTLISFKIGAETNRIIGPVLKRSNDFMVGLEKYTFTFFSQPNKRALLHTRPPIRSQYYKQWAASGDPLLQVAENPVPKETIDGLIGQSIMHYGVPADIEAFLAMSSPTSRPSGPERPDDNKPLKVGNSNNSLELVKAKESPAPLSPGELAALKIREMGIDVTVNQWLVMQALFESDNQTIKYGDLETLLIKKYGLTARNVLHALQTLNLLRYTNTSGNAKSNTEQLVFLTDRGLRKYFLQLPANDSPRAGRFAHLNAIYKLVKKEWEEGRICKVDIVDSGRQLADITSMGYRALSPEELKVAGDNAERLVWNPWDTIAIEVEATPSSHWDHVAENIRKAHVKGHSKVRVYCLSRLDYQNLPKEMAEQEIDEEHGYHYELFLLSDLESDDDSKKNGLLELDPATGSPTAHEGHYSSNEEKYPEKQAGTVPGPETLKVSESKTLAIPEPLSVDEISALLKRDECVPGKHGPGCPRLRSDVKERLEQLQFRLALSPVDGSIIRARCYQGQYIGKELGRQKKLEKSRQKNTTASSQGAS